MVSIALITAANCAKPGAGIRNKVVRGRPSSVERSSPYSMISSLSMSISGSEQTDAACRARPCPAPFRAQLDDPNRYRQCNMPHAMSTIQQHQQMKLPGCSHRWWGEELLRKRQGAHSGPLITRKSYHANQLSTSSPPCWAFHSFSVLWLPPLVSTISPECGFL